MFKKFIKYTLIVSGGGFLILTGFLIYSLSLLPEPIRFKRAVESIQTTKKESVQKHTVENSPDAKFVENNVVEKYEQTSNPSEQTTSKQLSEKVFENLRKEEFSDIRVCENLGNKTHNELNDDVLIRAFNDEDRNDPLLESFRIPIKSVFQSKPVKELLEELESIPNIPEGGIERTDFLKKTGFYAIAAKKVYELYRSKSEFEKLGDRAFHLHLMSKIVALKPELKNDKSLNEFCKEVETSIGSKDSVNIDEEREEVLKLIEYAGLTPKELGFNPDMKTRFEIELKDNSVRFGLSHPGMGVN